MRSTRPLLIFNFSLFLTLLFAPTIARADDDDAEDYDVNARVVRLSFIHGDVSVRRHDGDQWETVRLNTPLVEGDAISTGAEARAEIQIDARNFLRIAQDSVLRIVTLRNEGIALSLSEGTATLRLARFDHDHEYFEIDAPKTTVAAESKGLYRLDANRDGSIHVSVRDGGRARVYSETAGFTVRDGRSAILNSQGADAGDWQTTNALGPDTWDEWVFAREQSLAKRFKYDEKAGYYDADVWGGEDLDAYGAWSNTSEYGWIWRPNITIINNYNDWAPYRYGSWVWCSPYGWTWVGDEPFGWAPYHYGRWVFYNGYWAWCPRSYYHRNRSWWRPALVAFISIDFSFGSHYCWYPLSYRQRDYHSRYFHRDHDRLRPLSRDELANLRRTNPAFLRAVTSVPARDFGNQGTRPQAARGDLARRAVDADPLRAQLPTRPAVAAGNNGNRSGRPAAATPAAPVWRPTGATTRQPGVALDNELRRSRIFNGRNPVSTPSGTNAAQTPNTRPTGAVARPAPSNSQPISRPPDFNRPSDDNNSRPARPSRPREDPVNRAPTEATPRRDRNPDAGRTERPAAPATTSRPERPTESRRPETAAPRQDPPQRSDPPARSEPAPRSDPPARSEPAPRSDPPARSEPAPRSDPPARSEPAPRSDPPARSSPPEQRYESSRSSSSSSTSSSGNSSHSGSSRSSDEGSSRSGRKNEE